MKNLKVVTIRRDDDITGVPAKSRRIPWFLVMTAMIGFLFSASSAWAVSITMIDSTTGQPPPATPSWLSSQTDNRAYTFQVSPSTPVYPLGLWSAVDSADDAVVCSAPTCSFQGQLDCSYGFDATQTLYLSQCVQGNLYLHLCVLEQSNTAVQGYAVYHLETDNISPSAPGALAATPASSTQINLSWTAATDNIQVAGYRITRNGVLLSTVGSAVLSYNDTSCSPGTAYSYQVIAFDDAGNQGIAATVSTTTPPSSVPLAIAITNPPAPGVWLNGAVGGAGYAFSTTPPNANPALYPAYGFWDTSAVDDNRACTTTGRYGFDPSDLMYSNTIPQGDMYLHLCLQQASQPSNQAFSVYQFLTDNTPPTVPAGLTATAVSPSQINLSWGVSADNLSGVGGYKVFRNGIQVGTTGPLVTTYSDAGLSPSTVYTYTVSAYDQASPPNVSGLSSPASATTLPSPVPLAIAITNPPAPGVWLNGASGGTAYTFITNPQNADPALYPAYGFWDASPTDDNRACTTTGRYGFNPGYPMYSNTIPQGDMYLHLCLQQASQPSNQAFSVYQFLTDNTPPTVPAGLTATAVSQNQISLSWGASADSLSGLGGYTIFRNGVQVGTTSPLVTTYSDSGLSPGTLYAYTVSAYDQASPPNVSALSGSASATTLPSPVPLAITITNPPAPGVWLNGTAGGAGYTFSTTPPDADPALYPAYGFWDASPTDDNRACTTTGRYGFDPTDPMYSNTIPQGDMYLHLCIQQASQPSNQAFSVYQFLTDNTPPSIPAGLTAVSSGTTINLSWNASLDTLSGVAGYQIYRNGSQLASIAGTTYADMNLAIGTYTYAVSAYDAAIPPNISAVSVSTTVVLSPPSGSQLITLQGRFGIVIGDTFQQGGTWTQYSLQTSTGTFQLIFSNSQDAVGLTPGSDVQVTGYIQGNQFLVPSSSAIPLNQVPAQQVPASYMQVVHRAAAVPQAVVSGQRKIAIILINYLNQTSQPITQAQAASLISTASQFYQEASYQQYSISADIYGYFSLPINETCSSTSTDTGSNDAFTTITNAGIQAAQNAGINLSSYQSYMFIGPTATSCFGGFATVGGTPPGLILIRVNAFGTNQAAIMAHELGHNLGLYHPQSFACNTAVYNPNVNCGSLDAGDLFDVMGGAVSEGESPYFDSSYKSLFNWITPQLLTGTGVYKISPIEVSGTSVMAAEIVPAGETDSFYIEFRQPIGFDSNLLSNQVYNGVLLHVGGNPDHILNMHPANTAPSTPPLQPALLPGEKYTDYANRFSVTTISTSTASVQVRILIPSASAPTLMFVSPSSGSVVSGTTVVGVDALDLNGVTELQLFVDGTLIGTQGAAVSEAGIVVTTPTYSFSWNTTQETPGNHTLMAKAYNAAGQTFSQSITVQVAPPLSVSITAPVAGATLPMGAAPITAAVQVGAAPVAGVQFFANGTFLGAGSATNGNSYSLTWNPAAPGTYSLTAIVTDSAGNTSTSAAVSVTVGNFLTPSISFVSPANNAVFTAPATVNVQTQIVDPSGVVSRIVVMVNGQVNCMSSAVSNCWVTLQNLPAGSYQVVGQLFGSSGNLLAASASPVVFTVTQVVAAPASIISLDLPGILSVNSVIQAEVSVPIQGIQWALTPLGSAGAPSTVLPGVLAGAFPPAQALYRSSTSGLQLNLAALGVMPGWYQIMAAAVEMQGQLSAPAQANVELEGIESPAAVRVYPDPWRSDQHAGLPITFDGLEGNTTIKLFTISAHWIKTLTTSGSSVTWDLTNDGGERVASGIYLYLMTNDQGQKTKGKLAIIR